MNEKRIRFFEVLSLIVILYVFARVILTAYVGDDIQYATKYDTPAQYIQVLSENLETVQGFEGHLHLFSHMKDDILGGYIEADIKFDLRSNVTGDIHYRSTREDICEEIQYYLEQIGTEFNVYTKEAVWTGRNIGVERGNRLTNIYYVPHVIEQLLIYGEEFVFGTIAKMSVELNGTLPADRVYDFMNQCNFFALAGGTEVSRSAYIGISDVPFTLIVTHEGIPLGLQMELGHVLEVVVNNINDNLSYDTEYVTIQRFYIEQTMERFDEEVDVHIPAEAYDGVNYFLESSVIEAQLSLARDMYW